MKKLLLGFIFVSCIANSQNINFPDANFKAKLVSASPSNNIASNAQGNHFKIDVNNDGEIQQSEAVLVYSLNIIGGGITSIAGIEYFSELRNLDITANTISANSLQGFLNLQSLTLQNNQTTSVSLANLPQLQSLTIQENSLSSFSGVIPSVGAMTFKSNNLTSLDLTGWTSLGLLYVGGNQLQALNLDNLTLHTLHVAADTPIDTLDLSGNTMLDEVDLDSSDVKHLNLSGCSSLYIVELMNTS
ncbi:hypothetical protein HUK80_08045 [Flavobacterium sp. MAH-1]|uniref:Leucine rich repeat-containing protein n=1 Tax=Flavobacterium agri TaxID=2743471 RepID=A0A7Y9C5W7_9FLAO|nr:hypothetical protein [Flavobacterium agri]NUY80840.1 hypothetical protein [Flavobacterium agri]NYA70864.1 hypothetical protein [Flavobacterium agri]